MTLFININLVSGRNIHLSPVEKSNRCMDSYDIVIRVFHDLKKVFEPSKETVCVRIRGNAPKLPKSYLTGRS